MKATYDKKADALSVQLLPDGLRETTIRVAPGILLHLDQAKRPIELEIIGASEHYAPAELERLGSPVEWLTLAEASREFGLSPSTLRNQVLNEKIPATKSGRDWLVTRADMVTYLDNRSPSGRPARRRKARRAQVVVIDVHLDTNGVLLRSALERRKDVVVVDRGKEIAVFEKGVQKPPIEKVPPRLQALLRKKSPA